MTWKGRGWGPFFAAPRRGMPPASTWRARTTTSSSRSWLSAEAVDNIEAIAAVPGVDLIFAAAYDLSVNLGHPGDAGHPEVTSAFRRVEAAALAAGVPIRVQPDADAVVGLVQQGYRNVAVGFDWSVYQRAVAAALAPVVDRLPKPARRGQVRRKA